MAGWLAGSLARLRASWLASWLAVASSKVESGEQRSSTKKKHKGVGFFLFLFFSRLRRPRPLHPSPPVLESRRRRGVFFRTLRFVACSRCMNTNVWRFRYQNRTTVDESCAASGSADETTQQREECHCAQRSITEVGGAHSCACIITSTLCSWSHIRFFFFYSHSFSFSFFELLSLSIARS